MRSKIFISIGFIIFLAWSIFLTLNRHSKSGRFGYHSEIYADKSGYYVYLPAALKYNFDSRNFPDSIETKIGNGFRFNTETNKVITKYYYGVAFMQLPFFVIAEMLAQPLGFDDTGFSLLHHKMVDIAAVVYLVLAFVLLSKFLRREFGRTVVFLALLSIFLSTNLYYYSIDETGMSHIYSFFLFSAFLYLLRKTNFLEHSNYMSFLLFGIISGLIIVVRPSNVIFLSTYIFLDVNSKIEIQQRVSNVFRPQFFLTAMVGAFIMILPQLLYWNYAYGSYFSYSYGDEGFNWLYPKILHTWFSPTNGLFLYNPFYLIIIASSIYMLSKKATNGLTVALIFVVISYVLSAWWDWSFGCSFGARSFVEYLAMFVIPVAYLFNRAQSFSKYYAVIFWVFIILLAIYNLKLTYSYDGCFYGHKNWDWPTFYEILVSQTK